MSDAEESNQKLEALNKAFLEKMPGHLEEIQKLWGDLGKGSGEDNPAEALRMMVHKLLGSAGTFGFKEISDLLEPFEAFLNLLMSEERGPTEAEILQHDELITSFRVLVEKAVAGKLVETAEESEGQARTNSDESSDDEEDVTVRVRKKRILVADDAILLRKRLVLAMKSSGFDVFEADHGRAAIAMAKKKDPDLILMDVMMPQMDGMEALQAMRKDAILNQIPVFMMTGQNTMEDVKKAMEMGVQDFISKPYQPDDVVKRINEFFRKRNRVVPTSGFDGVNRILVVDDSDLLRKRICICLEEDGHMLLEAGNGHEALEKAHEFVPDLVLMDVMMPVMNGLDTLRRMRMDPLLSKVPVIMLTSKNTIDDVRAASHLGISDYISKPFDPDSVLPRVHKCLARTKSRKN